MLLLDEVEKSHSDLFNIFLQIMDYGKLTDHNGKSIDFRNVILIMTTNVGATDRQKETIGFCSSRQTGGDEEAINRLFSPEFRNRLDAIIPFASLPEPVIHKVVEKFVMQLEAQLAERNITFELSSDAIKWLAKQGYNEQMGARQIGRVIQEHIKEPLADEILFGELKQGGTVFVTLTKDKDKDKGSALTLKFLKNAPVKPKKETLTSQKTAPKRKKHIQKKRAPLII